MNDAYPFETMRASRTKQYAAVVAVMLATVDAVGTGPPSVESDPVTPSAS